MVGDIVFFHGKKFVILHEYTSNYYEIKEERNPFHIELAHKSEVILLNKRNRNLSYLLQESEYEYLK